MSTITITKLYALLSDKVGKETAENLTSFIEEKIQEEVENKSQALATKEDLHTAKEDLFKAISNLEVKIGESKVDIIKWVFSFFVALALMIIGLYLRK